METNLNISDKAEYLRKHGHFLFRRPDNAVGTNYTKFYLFDGAGFAVIFKNDIPVQIEKKSAESVELMDACYRIQFGGF